MIKKSGSSGRSNNWLFRSVQAEVPRNHPYRMFLAVLIAVVAVVGVLAAGSLSPQPAMAQPSGIDSYGAEVISLTPGEYFVPGLDCDVPPNNQGGTGSSALGAPDDPTVDGSDFATDLSTSLGRRGSITIRFNTPAAGDNDTGTPDVWVWEAGGAAEPYQVDVSEDGSNWLMVGLSDSMTHGSQGFDVDHVGLDNTAQIWFIRVTDVNTAPGEDVCNPDADYTVMGSDIDAVGAITVAAIPGIELVKTNNVTPGTELAVDDVVTYSFEVTNTGTVDLVDVFIADELDGIYGFNPASLALLEPGTSATFTASYDVTQADIDAGFINNTATATGEPSGFCPDCGPASSVPASNQIVIPQNAALELVKDARPETSLNEGDTVTYAVTATNTGNVTLNDVIIEDPLPGLTWVSRPGIGTLAPGASATVTATYEFTAEDVVNGGVTNTATAICVPDCTVTPDSATVTPGEVVLSIVKSADPAFGVDEGDVITYSFVVTNSGTVTAHDVTIVDELAGLTWVTGPNVGTLLPGATATGSATYVVTETDITNGGVGNLAYATCHLADCISPSAAVYVPAGDAALSLEKTADPAADVGEGDTITYTFTATNTGGLTLNDVTIDDPLPGLTWVSGPNVGTLGPGASASATATYVVTADDVSAGSVTNTATATCSPACAPAPVTVVVPVAALEPGAIALDKTANTSGEAVPGDVVTYTFVVTNTGPGTLENVTVADTLPGLSAIEGPQGGALASGESATFSAQYTVTEADADAGSIVNSATASGVDETGATVTAADSVTVTSCSLGDAGPGDDATPIADDEFAGQALCPGVDPDPTTEPEPQPTNVPTQQPPDKPVIRLPSTGSDGSASGMSYVALTLAGLAVLGAVSAWTLMQRRSRR